MGTAKDELKSLLEQQPEDSSSEELVRELALHVMIQRGLADSDAGRTISNEKMGPAYPVVAEVNWALEAQKCQCIRQ